MKDHNTNHHRAAKPEWRVFAFVANSIGNDLAGTAWNDRPYARQIAEHVFEAIENAGYEVRKRDE